MFDINQLKRELSIILSNPEIAVRIGETREELHKSSENYQSIWLCYTISLGSEGVHQWKSACEFFGISVQDGCPGWIWEDIGEKADLLVTQLTIDLDDILPPGCFFSIGHWESGGCYGIVLGYSYDEDPANWVEITFLKTDWEELQRLKYSMKVITYNQSIGKAWCILEEYLV